MNRKKLAVLSVLTVLVMCFIFYNSFQNSAKSNAASDVIEEIVEPIVEEIVGENVLDINYLVRKGAHLTEFFVLGVLVISIIQEVKKHRKYLFGYGLFYVLLVAVTDEYIQSLSDRTSSVADVFIDFSGAMIGFGAVLLVNGLTLLIKERIKNKQKEKHNGNTN